VYLVVEDKMTISELIKEGVELFNPILSSSDANFLLDSKKCSEYKLRRSKKNGKPDMEIPGTLLVKLALNHETTVMTTGINKFALVYNNKDIIMLKEDKSKNDFYKCKKCFIL
jgi:hypothetical protein